jgi:superfamily II DNA or RNA helicase
VSKKGLFLTGFLPKVFEYLHQKKIVYEFINHPHQFIVPGMDYFDKILRPEQNEAINHILKCQRGVIHYPTGSGKTKIFISFIGIFPEANALILLHRQDLLLQTYSQANEAFPGQVGIIGNGVLEPNRITIAMVQTLSKIEPTEFHREQDILIVDETHHVNNFSGTYYKTLTSIPSPIRLGFTATLPSTEKGRMALEGLIGPVIVEKKPQEIKSLAKIIIKLRKIPFSKTIHELHNWKDVYKMGVVHNSQRHKMVLEDTVELVNQGKTVLILVVEIQHGYNLMEMAKAHFPDLNIEFVWGQTSSEDRVKVKKLLNEGNFDAVIANAVWREGIDIPSLGSIVNAAGGKSEIVTIQSIGRGLRTTGDKKEVILVDYFDPSNRYLVDHFGHRLTLYFDEGWL